MAGPCCWRAEILNIPHQANFASEKKKKQEDTQAIKLPSLTRVQGPQIKIYNHCALMIITTGKRNLSVAVSSVSWHKTPGLQYTHNPDSKESVITCHMQPCSFLPALEMIGYFKGHFSNSNQSFPFLSQMRGYISSFSRIPVLYIFSSQWSPNDARMQKTKKFTYKDCKALSPRMASLGTVFNWLFWRVLEGKLGLVNKKQLWPFFLRRI